MTASRIKTGLVVAMLGIALSTGTASALDGCNASNSDCTTTRHHHGGGGSTTSKPSTEVLPESETAPELALTPDEAPASQTAPAGELPFTGSDVAGMTLIGAAAIGIGTVMVRRSRTRTSES